MHIIINGTFHEVTEPWISGKELKQMGDIPSVDTLYVREPEGIEEVKDHIKVFMSDRKVFVSAAAPGYSS